MNAILFFKTKLAVNFHMSCYYINLSIATVVKIVNSKYMPAWCLNVVLKKTNKAI